MVSILDKKNPNSKEADSRVKIDKCLMDAGWRFEDSKNGKANIQTEVEVKCSKHDNDSECRPSRGRMDYLLHDKDGRALVVLEAKSESKHPLIGKEQARGYAENIGARFVILSNGATHYFWDTSYGNPYRITRFPTQDSITQYNKYVPNPQELAQTVVDENYIIESQMPRYFKDPAFQDESTRAHFLKKNSLKQLRPYQVEAIKALQASAKNGKDRFLFEMATGTGKTLVSAAVIKLFLKSGNARRILFLVDRIELENQAQDAFKKHLGRDFTSVIYKEDPNSWQNANIVVSTVQTFISGDRYKKAFSPMDFELVISDEAHRSIGGGGRAVFEYFVGYKLGLTATPKNYLKNIDAETANTKREYERRLLLDTYQTFGCEPGKPTFSYDLIRGVKEGYLISPTVIDARTTITTQLLSEQGYAIRTTTEDGENVDEVFDKCDFEKKFFNEETNISMCKAFLDKGLYDPVAQECGISLFGKSIVFCRTQSHAARFANILNKLASERWPEQYSTSDFAMQVTSQIQTAQQMTINFANNRLGGQAKQPEGYETSKTRVVVTVNMMTTGYDCQDILNIALMRPVVSPSDFVQMKGRGTRKWTFEYDDGNNEPIKIDKDQFKLFDFFASCEYFEHEFKYDEEIKLPQIQKIYQVETTQDEFVDENGNKVFNGPVDIEQPDEIVSIEEMIIGEEGMRIDRENFKNALQEDIVDNKELQIIWKNGDTEAAEDFAKKKIFNKPKYFLNLEKIRKIFNLDRDLSIKEVLQYAFGEKEYFETKDELLELEFEKFENIYKIDLDKYEVVRKFFKAYIEDPVVRDIIETKQFANFCCCATFDFQDFQKLGEYKTIVPQYVNDYAQHLIKL